MQETYKKYIFKKDILGKKIKDISESLKGSTFSLNKKEGYITVLGVETKAAADLIDHIETDKYGIGEIETMTTFLPIFLNKLQYDEVLCLCYGETIQFKVMEGSKDLYQDLTGEVLEGENGCNNCNIL